MNRFLSSRLARGAVVLVAIGGWAAWEFGYKASVLRNTAWQGSLVETYEKRCWWMGMQKWNRPHYHYYDHYWRVRLADGREISVEVPWSAWQDAKAGDPILKVLGERFPRVNTPQAQGAREAVDRALGGSASIVPTETERKELNQ